MHRGADVVEVPGFDQLGGAQAAAGGVGRLVDVHLKPGPGHGHGRGQSVGSGTDDGDVRHRGSRPPGQQRRRRAARGVQPQPVRSAVERTAVGIIHAVRGG